MSGSKQAASALLVGVAVVVFLAVRWPWDLLVLVALIGISVLLSRMQRTGFRTALPGTLLLYSFLFLTLFTAVGVYARTSVRTAWLPLPALVGFGVLAALAGVAWLFLGARAKA
jgi:hypothetical protein